MRHAIPTAAVCAALILGLSLWGCRRAKPGESAATATPEPTVAPTTVASAEQQVIAEVKVIAAAEAAYKAANQGLYESDIACLSPAADPCIPGYQGPPFVKPELATLATRFGYQRALYASARVQQAGTSAGSARQYAYVARPTAPGGRAFCADGTGKLVFVEYGSDALQGVGEEGLAESGGCVGQPLP